MRYFSCVLMSNLPVIFLSFPPMLQMDHSMMNHSMHHDHHAMMNHTVTDHSNMDHSNMDHSNMDHSNMDHSNMDHSNMDHGSMGMDHMMMVSRVLFRLRSFLHFQNALGGTKVPYQSLCILLL